MAQQIPCDICQQTTADFMITAISNGDTIGVGIECVAAWAEGLVTAYEAAIANNPANNPATDGMPPKRARKKKAAAPVTDDEWEASAGVEGQTGRHSAPDGGGDTSEEDRAPETVTHGQE
jgi:hypothetical protein